VSAGWRDARAPCPSAYDVRKVVQDAIVEDIARILRLPKDDISRVRQLSEIGLDSLMGAQEARDADRRSPAGLGLLLGPHRGVAR
jgi:hypothetical protein